MRSLARLVFGLALLGLVASFVQATPARAGEVLEVIAEPSLGAGASSDRAPETYFVAVGGAYQLKVLHHSASGTEDVTNASSVVYTAHLSESVTVSPSGNVVVHAYLPRSQSPIVSVRYGGLMAGIVFRVHP